MLREWYSPIFMDNYHRHLNLLHFKVLVLVLVVVVMFCFFVVFFYSVLKCGDFYVKALLIYAK